MSHRFLYRFVFEWQNLNITCEIDKEYRDITVLEELSKYSHGSRRSWATKLLQRYIIADELYQTYCDGSSSKLSHFALSDFDFTCPFGKEVKNHLEAPWRMTFIQEGSQVMLRIQVLFDTHKFSN